MSEKIKQKIHDVIVKNRPESTQDLINVVIDETGYDKTQVQNMIINMIENKEISLKNIKENTYFKDYLFGYELYWFWAMMGGVLCYIFILVSSNIFVEVNSLKIIFGGLYTIFFPGYALIRALYVEDAISIVERTALSVGLSLAITPMISFVLNFSPWGISLHPLVFSLSFFT